MREVKIITVREESGGNAIKVDAPDLALQYWRDHIDTAPWYSPDKEHLVALLLNTKYSVISHTLISMGSLNESIAHPREIFRPAIVAAAFAFILMHNHPSGDSSPSEADMRLTRRLSEGAQLLNIGILDHIIVGAGANRYSFKESGIL